VAHQLDRQITSRLTRNRPLPTASAADLAEETGRLDGRTKLLSDVFCSSS